MKGKIRRIVFAYVSDGYRDAQNRYPTSRLAPSESRQIRCPSRGPADLCAVAQRRWQTVGQDCKLRQRLET